MHLLAYAQWVLGVVPPSSPPLRPLYPPHITLPCQMLSCMQDIQSTAATHAGELKKTLEASFLRQKQGEEAAEFKQVGGRGGPLLVVSRTVTGQAKHCC